MKTHVQLLVAILLLCYAPGLEAQENTVVSGGTASGGGGSMTYSVGQVHNITLLGSGGSMSEGVQQPYEFYTIGLDEPGINMFVTAYPIPTRTSITLRIEDIPLPGIRYEIYDLQGKPILYDDVTKSETVISTDELPEAVYFLQVSREGQVLETIKIIKSQ